MAQNYATASVTYTFIAPDDEAQKKNNHIIKDLIETPDEAKLVAIGDVLQKLITNQSLTTITLSTDTVLEGDSGAEPETEAPQTEEPGTEEPAPDNGTQAK